MAPLKRRRRAFARACALVVALWAANELAFAAPAPAPPAVPKRIASLNLSGDELLIELVPPERLVTVTSFADDPEMSNVVGRMPSTAQRVTRAKMETLVALRPDLVVVSEFTEADFLHLLSTSGLAYHRLVIRSLDDVAPSILALGQAVGETEKARKLADGFTASLAALATRLDGVRRPRVLYWSDPYTAGRDTVVDDVLERSGAANVARELGLRGFAPVPAERAFASNPEYIVIRLGGRTREALLAHPVLSRLDAVKKGRIVEVPAALLSTLTHHNVETCTFLARALHPERFAETKK